MHAYVAADRETCLKMLRKAEGALRGEFAVQLFADGSVDEVMAS